MTEQEKKQRVKQLLEEAEQLIRECREVLKGETHD